MPGYLWLGGRSQARLGGFTADRVQFPAPPDPEVTVIEWLPKLQYAGRPALVASRRGQDMLGKSAA